MPNLDELTFSSVDLTAEDFEHVLKICRPECFMFRRSTILISPTIPTNAAALDHVTSALRGTSTTMKSITVSALDGSDMCLRAILHGVENHENLTTTVWGFYGVQTELIQDNANAIVEFLQQSKGKYKRFVMFGFLCHGSPSFISVAEAFCDSSSHSELEMPKHHAIFAPSFPLGMLRKRSLLVTWYFLVKLTFWKL
jgi:hypothetical protein